MALCHWCSRTRPTTTSTDHRELPSSKYPLSSTPTYLTYTASDDSWLATNGAGTRTGFWGYDAFGNLAFGTAGLTVRLYRAVHRRDDALVNDRARWYESGHGRIHHPRPRVRKD